ncbi:homing endonuclease [Wiseana iridescent virus]|uniref:DUF7487 domain-containing protein n=1 Tax=Wiseana iridescent virus TaxID=68347 RepID=G0T538_IRV9|nr:homing endonuclease [Wiseana iridescent virus]ADO00355.1 hypothetical protein [Wiseana iridescent virus]
MDSLFEEKKNDVYNHTGHILLEKESKSNKFKYQCGNCGLKRKGSYRDLMRPNSTKFCGKCIDPGRKTLDEVIEKFEQLKFEESIPDYTIMEYITNKKVTFKCDYNHVFIMAYHDIKRGRRCPNCAPHRRAKTNLERYGTVNPFSSEKIKEKIKNTCLEKYGVSHHMKLESIRNKAVETNLQKLGVKYAFNTEETFEKIRKIHFKNYGVRFPLQSTFIQSKISQTFLKKIGTNRPMSNQPYWKNCLLDKYGVDHYSKTNEYKVKYTQTCMDRYGVDHPMKNIKIFSKVISSAFTRKPFTFPSGRVDFVLGYEPRALAELLLYYNEEDIITDLWLIPTFDYKRVSTILRPLNKKSVVSRYFPDILLPDKIIEVKSTYLYYKDKSNVNCKMKTVAKAGYYCELWVYNSKNIEFKKSYKMVNNKVEIEKWIEIEE